jgi:hypothetical protein
MNLNTGTKDYISNRRGDLPSYLPFPPPVSAHYRPQYRLNLMRHKDLVKVSYRGPIFSCLSGYIDNDDYKVPIISSLGS